MLYSKKSLEDIEKYLKILVDVLESAPDALEDYRQKFEDLLLEIDDYKAEEDSDEISGEEENSQMYGQKRPFRGEEPVFEAIPKLKQRKTATSRRTDIIVDGIDEGKDKTFRGFTLRMITTLRSFFKENLRHFSTQVWYEIVYFCSSGRLYKAFFPPTRLVTQAAIENPQYFVGHFSLECQSDTTVMYNLHLECGRLINLYDWFIAFKSVVDPDKKEDTKTLQCVSLFQFLKRRRKA